MNAKKIKIISLVILGIAVIFLIIACNIPVNLSYTYSYAENEIITHSSSEFLLSSLGIIFYIVMIYPIFATAYLIFLKTKRKTKIFGSITFTWIICILSVTIIILSVEAIMPYDKTAYYPECYRFSDNNHTVVIEEKSFLLYGGGTIYQIKENGEAVIIGTISTDDGGRNNGDYDIKWHDTYAEVTYNNFVKKGSKSTEKVIFE